MNRTTLFAIGAIIAVICLIIAIVYFVGGSALGHHIKHGLFFLGIAIIAGLFAAVNRPMAVSA